MNEMYTTDPLKPTLLIVDDVELNRALLTEMFHEHYTICEAKNGKEAVEILEQQSDTISVVLLDIIMPVLDGFGVLKEMIRRNWIGQIPVVMITAETSDSVMQKGYEMGVADIISKPFNPNIVRQRIGNIIEQYTYKLHLEQLVQEQTKTLQHQSQQLRENSVQIIDILSAIIEFKNTESVQHIYNIRIITKLLLNEFAKHHKEYGLTPQLIESISDAAAMHDIGKIAIPDQILNKPGKLTPEEFEIMKTHAICGCEILEKLSAVHSLAYYDYCYEICRHHHERWDGQGYPDGLTGGETPIWAQAVAIADVYDALISKRVYKDAYSAQTAVSMILDGQCGVFNPLLIDCFLKMAPALAGCASEAYLQDFMPIKRPDIPSAVQQEKTGAADVSARTLRLLEMERQKYQIMSELSEEILFEYDVKEDILTFSEKFQLLTGRDLILKSLRGVLDNPDIVNANDKNELYRRLRKITPANPACKLEMRINLSGNKLEWFKVFIYPIWDTEYEPQCVSYIGKLINIEQQKVRNIQLQKAAESDPLTKTLNRKAIEEQITAILSSGQVEYAALCFLDVDNFKAVNDNFGHIFGDKVLQFIAAILNSSVRKTDLAGRIGGDEFILLFRDIKGPVLEEKAIRLHNSLHNNFNGCDISCSIGISRFPKDGTDYETLLYRADQALYLSKRLGKDSYQIYNADCENMPFRSLLTGVDEYDERIETMAQELRQTEDKHE